MSGEERNGYVVKTVFWTLILTCFAFAAGSYAFTYAAGVRIVDSVVCNDRLREQNNKDIANELQNRVDTVNKDVASKFDRLQRDISDIKISLAKLR